MHLEGLCKSFFGVQVLHDVGLELRPGEVLGLVGENGSGKSTTMNILGGVHQPDAGHDPRRRSHMRPRPQDAAARGIAFIHQELNLFRNLTVEENLFITGFPQAGRAACRSSTGARCASSARELLAAIDLEVAPGTPLARLSQGERQLVEIAKALGADARIVIFDEPTTSLTARETERLFAQIGRLRAQRHRASSTSATSWAT